MLFRSDRLWVWTSEAQPLPARAHALPLTEVLVSTAGTCARIAGLSVRSGLIGDFNLANLAAAFGVGRVLGILDSTIISGLESLPAVPGRLERVIDPSGEVTVLVDYAHKPDALEHKITIDYLGFSVANKFLLGFGLDYDGLGRNLADIYQLAE